jgi:hypothetical protein
MEKYLNNKIFYLRNKPVDQVVVLTSSQIIKKSFVRDFLPNDMKRLNEVDYKSFEIVIDLWYKGIGIPLSLEEKKSIRRTFMNPMNGNISITLLDNYIGLHELPCRKHGRKICCICSFRRECQLKVYVVFVVVYNFLDQVIS